MGMMAMVIGGVLGIAKGIGGANSQNAAWAASEEARRKQNIQMVRQANSADANLRLQDTSNFQQARQQLESASLDAIKTQGTVQTAMAESGLEGRTMDRVKRDVDNVAIRTKGLINENYERDYANIYAQRVSNRDELISYLEGSQPAPKPNVGGQVIGTVIEGIGGAMTGSSLWGAFDAQPSSSAGKVTKASKQTK